MNKVTVEPEQPSDTGKLPNIKTVMRGKIKSCHDVPLDLLSSRSPESICTSSRYGLLFQLAKDGVRVSKWADVEQCYVEMEGVLLEGSSSAKVKDSIREPVLFATIKVGPDALAGMKLSPDETMICAWSSNRIFILDIGGLSSLDRPIYQANIDSAIEDVCFASDSRRFFVLAGKEIVIFDSVEYKEVSRVSCVEDCKGYSCACSEAGILAVSDSTGSVQFIKQDGSITLVMKVETEDPVEAHSIVFVDTTTLVVGFRNPVPEQEPNDDDEPGSLPLIGVFELNSDYTECLNSVLFEDPLEYDELDKPWEHRFYFSYLKHCNSVVVTSTWSRSMALIGSDKGIFNWRLMSITDRADDPSTAPEICNETIFSLAERPWVWAKEGEDDDAKLMLQNTTFVLGMTLSYCATFHIMPYHFFGDDGENESKPNYFAPPTLLVLNSDGLIETVALADRNFPMDASGVPIPGMIQTLEELPIPREIQTTFDEEKKEPDATLETVVENFAGIVQFTGHRPGFYFGTVGGVTGYFEDKPPVPTFVAPPAPAKPSTITKEQALASISAFYSAVNPTKLDKVQGLVDKYLGRYEILYEKLEGTYPGKKVPRDALETAQKEQNKLEQQKEESRKKEEERQREEVRRKEHERQQEELRKKEEEVLRQQEEERKREAERQRVLQAKQEEERRQLEVFSSPPPATTTRSPLPHDDGDNGETKSTRKKRMDREVNLFKSKLEHSIKQLQHKNAMLTKELERMKQQQLLEAPPRINQVALELKLESYSSPRKQSPMKTSMQVFSPTSSTSLEQETEDIFRGILLAVEEKDTNLHEDFDDLINKVYVREDQAFQEKLMEVGKVCNQQRSYGDNVLQPVIEKEREKLSAFRRNYLTQEFELKSFIEKVECEKKNRDLKSKANGEEKAVLTEKQQSLIQDLTEQLENLAMKYNFINSQIESQHQYFVKERARLQRAQHTRTFLSHVNKENEIRSTKQVLETSMSNYKAAQHTFTTLRELNAKLIGIKNILDNAACTSVSTPRDDSAAIMLVPEQQEEEEMKQKEEKSEKFVRTSIQDMNAAVQLNNVLSRQFSSPAPSTPFYPKICDGTGAEKHEVKLDDQLSGSGRQRKELRWRRSLLAKAAHQRADNAEAEKSAYEFLSSFAKKKTVKVGLDDKAQDVLEQFADPPKLKPVLPADVQWSAQQEAASSAKPRRSLSRSGPLKPAEEEKKKPDEPDDAVTKESSTTEEEKKPFSFGLSSGSLFSLDTSTIQEVDEKKEKKPSTPVQKEEAKKGFFGGESVSLGGNTAAAGGASLYTATGARDFTKIDLSATLREFYKIHKPDNIPKIETTIQRYKANPNKLLDNLETKYKTKVPLVARAGAGAADAAVPPVTPKAGAGGFASFATGTSSGFGSGGGGSSTSGNSSGFGFGGFGNENKPFGSDGGSEANKAGFGATSAGTPTSSPFGGTAGVAASSSPFGGQTQPQPGQPTNYREILHQFYMKHNPSKVNAIDTTLQRYKGREAEMFKKLEQKYGPGTTGFFNNTSNISNNSSFGQQANTGFGAFAGNAGSGGFGGSSFGGTGFGSGGANQQPSGFGNTSQQQPGFGNTGFGGASQQPQQEQAGFGTSPPQQQQSGFGSTGFGSTGFGGNSGTTGFGASGGFGTITGFGSGSPAGAPAAGAGFNSGNSGGGGGGGGGFAGFSGSSSGFGFGGGGGSTGGFGSTPPQNQQQQQSSGFGGFGGGGGGGFGSTGSFGGTGGGSSFSGSSFTQMRK